MDKKYEDRSLQPNIARLKHSVSVLRCMPTERFSMNTWACGTVACAFGSVAMTPYAHARKLTLSRSRGEVLQEPRYVAADGPYFGLSASMQYYNIDGRTAEWLFYPSSYTKRERDQDSNVQPWHVAARIESVIGAYT